MSKRKKHRKQKKGKPPRKNTPTSAMCRFKQKTRKKLGNIKVVETELKMSAVIMEFIQPYIDDIETLEQYRSLVSIAVIAWNAAIIPLSQRAEMLLTFEEVIPGDSSVSFQKVMEEFIERKQAYFPDINRFIVRYEVTETEDDWHLAIASNMTEEEAKQEGYL